MKSRYELEKYKGMRSRYECPNCHRKGVFVRYVDTETGGYLSSDVGRCNREDKCGYHYTPKQYFHDRPGQKPEFLEAIKNGKVTARSKVKNNEVTTMSNEKDPKVTPRCETESRIDHIPGGYVSRSLGWGSDFVRFLCTLFDRYDITSPTLCRLMSEYYLGCTSTGAVVYWQMSAENGQVAVRTGKEMRYDPDTGKRLKNGSGAVDWVHAKLKRAGVLPDGWELTQCLFGEHLLRRRTEDTVCLVESEKSAVIGSGVMPEYVWLATGGKQNLKAEKCECLKGRNVILFPDLGAFDDWKEKGERIARRVGFTISVSDTLERIATPQDRDNGLDIADYLIRQIRAGNHTENKQKTSIEPLSKAEKELQRMISRNPALSKLISSLDLVSAGAGRRLRTQIA